MNPLSANALKAKVTERQCAMINFGHGKRMMPVSTAGPGMPVKSTLSAGRFSLSSEYLATQWKDIEVGTVKEDGDIWTWGNLGELFLNRGIQTGLQFRLETAQAGNLFRSGKYARVRCVGNTGAFIHIPKPMKISSMPASLKDRQKSMKSPLGFAGPGTPWCAGSLKLFPSERQPRWYSDRFQRQRGWYRIC